jgi:replicative DNA helicase
MSNPGMIPRQNIEAEQSILGALLAAENASFVVMPILRNAEVFYKQEHQLVFNAVKELLVDGKTVDMITVSAKLTKAGKLQDVGGQYYLADCISKFTGMQHLENYAYIILEHYIARSVVATGSKLASDGFDETKDAIELLQDAREALDAVDDQITITQPRDWQTILKETTFEIERLSENDAPGTGIRTGFPKMDEITGGWQPGQFIIIAARPGMGKTAMAVKHVCDAARNSVPTGVFELEMRDVDFAKRIIANESNLHANQLFVHGLQTNSKDYWPGYWSTLEAIDPWPLHLVTRPGLSVYDFQIEARKMVQKHKVQLIIVDYIQLMSVGRESRTINNREQEISTISRMIKRTALELNIPIIALSQLSRAVETRTDKWPRLSDLRESGSLEQDADIVLFIHRPEYYQPDNDEPTTGQTDYIIEKHRNGSLASVQVYFDANRVKFQTDELHTQSVPF